MELDEWPRGWASFQNRWINDFSLTVSGQSVTLSQSPKADTGGTVWDAGIVLCKYLESLGPRVLREKKIIELGSGCGLVSISAALAGAEVVATDRPDMVERLRANVKQNMKRSIHRITVRPYSWGTPITDLPPCDIVLGSDITYFDDLYGVLVNSLDQLLALPSASDCHNPREAWLSYWAPRKDYAPLRRLLDEHFLVDVVRRRPAFPSLHARLSVGRGRIDTDSRHCPSRTEYSTSSHFGHGVLSLWAPVQIPISEHHPIYRTESVVILRLRPR